MFDWQTIAVALIVFGAFLYVARRGLKRLRSFRAGVGARSSCATGCGSCGSVEGEQSRKPAPLMVQISTRRTTPAGPRR